MLTPDQLFQSLFTDVQSSATFVDSKTFVDMIPKFDAPVILDQYHNTKNNQDFNLLTFIESHFDYPSCGASHFKTDISKKTAEHISDLWEELTRQSDQDYTRGSLLPLPHKYIVPGGRFREIYYWDSYFTMLGLKEDGRVDLIVSMIDNFSYLINRYGHIPNGNRSYYLSRSQPPFYSLMISLLMDIQGDTIVSKYLTTLVKEHDYWTKNERRNIYIDQHKMQRYYDALDIPRQESYVEDMHLSNGDPILNRQIRSGAESGWDFSSRWRSNPNQLSSIDILNVLPVDLNSLLFHLEDLIAKAYQIEGSKDLSNKYRTLADQRNLAIRHVFLDRELNIYSDYLIAESKTSDRLSLAMMFPMFMGLATQSEADAIAIFIEREFLKEGGLITTLVYSGQQWDAPNGWPPLQWVAIKALDNYGHVSLAKEIAKRWLTLVDSVYHNTGKLMEKYNVVDLTLTAGGGEYPVQDGFGWTNGVYQAMKAFLMDN